MVKVKLPRITYTMNNTRAIRELMIQLDWLPKGSLSELIDNDSNSIYHNNRVTEDIMHTVVGDSENVSNNNKLTNSKKAKKKRLPRRKANDPTIRVGDMVRLRMPTLIDLSEWFAIDHGRAEWTKYNEEIVNKNQSVRVVDMNKYHITIINKGTYADPVPNLLYFPLCCATRIINKSAIQKNEEVNVMVDDDRNIKL